MPGGRVFSTRSHTTLLSKYLLGGAWGAWGLWVREEKRGEVRRGEERRREEKHYKYTHAHKTKQTTGVGSLQGVQGGVTYSTVSHSIPSLVYSSCSILSVIAMNSCCSFSLQKLMHSFG